MAVQVFTLVTASYAHRGEPLSQVCDVVVAADIGVFVVCFLLCVACWLLLTVICVTAAVAAAAVVACDFDV